MMLTSIAVRCLCLQGADRPFLMAEDELRTHSYKRCIPNRLKKKEEGEVYTGRGD